MTPHKKMDIHGFRIGRASFIQQNTHEFLVAVVGLPATFWKNPLKWLWGILMNKPWMRWYYNEFFKKSVLVRWSPRVGRLEDLVATKAEKWPEDVVSVRLYDPKGLFEPYLGKLVYIKVVCLSGELLDGEMVRAVRPWRGK